MPFKNLARINATKFKSDKVSDGEITRIIRGMERNGLDLHLRHLS